MEERDRMRENERETIRHKEIESHIITSTEVHRYTEHLEIHTDT